MLLCAGLAAAAAAPRGVPLPVERRVPGGIALLQIPVDGPSPGAVFFNEHRAPVVQGPEGWVAVVGLPLDLAPGAHAARYVPAGGDPPEQPLAPQCLSMRAMASRRSTSTRWWTQLLMCQRRISSITPATTRPNTVIAVKADRPNLVMPV